MRSRSRHIRLRVGALTLAAALPACEREERRFREIPPAATAYPAVTMSSLYPGEPVRDVDVRNPYEENAFAVSEGQRLYSWYNCNGCHALGGGGIGPPLMDGEWIYGSEPENIFATIVQGRPNGMPSFRGRIPDYQVWQLVSYVRALGGLTPSATRPARTDDMKALPNLTLREPRRPQQSFVPPPSERP